MNNFISPGDVLEHKQGFRFPILGLVEMVWHLEFVFAAVLCQFSLQIVDFVMFFGVVVVWEAAAFVVEVFAIVLVSMLVMIGTVVLIVVLIGVLVLVKIVTVVVQLVFEMLAAFVASGVGGACNRTVFGRRQE